MNGVKKIVVFGTNKLSELMVYYLGNDERYELSAFAADDAYVCSDRFMGFPLVRTTELTEKYPPESYKIILTIGYSFMNNVRSSKFAELKRMGYEFENYFHPSSTILSDRFGEGNIVLENCSIGPFCEFGNANIMYSSTTVAHHGSIGDFNFFSVECAVAGNITICNNCFFGVNCTVRDSITVADYTLVGAGAYISRSTQPYEVYSPQRSILLDKKSTDISL